MNYLLDTCVVSEVTRKNPDTKVLDWLGQQNELELFLSVITLGELEKGISKLSDGKKKRQIRQWFEKDLRMRFNERILSIDEKVALKWGEIQGQAEKIGQKLSTLDGIIAATAIANDLTIVTRDYQDMEASCAKIFNPWE